MEELIFLESECQECKMIEFPDALIGRQLRIILTSQIGLDCAGYTLKLFDAFGELLPYEAELDIKKNEDWSVTFTGIFTISLEESKKAWGVVVINKNKEYCYQWYTDYVPNNVKKLTVKCTLKLW